jgi:2-phospho-L-lactate/phosphoenolpyruvate guanylyltransferase
MRVIAVPVKSLERSKSRLAAVLGPSERAALTLAMLEDVLDAALAQYGWEVWMISSDEAVLEVAARRGARPIAEESRSLLRAVRQVERDLPGRSSRLALLLGDLPFVTAEALAEALRRSASVVAVPAHSDGGTNLLLRKPPSVIPPRFGRASFAKHRWAARRARVSFDDVDIPDLAFDLDRPSDLTVVLDAPRPGRTRQVCLEMDLSGRLGAAARQASR